MLGRWLTGSGRGNLGRGAQATEVNSFLKKFVNKMNSFLEGWLPGSGRGNLGRGAQATQVNSFLEKLLTKLPDVGRGGCLHLEEEIWGEEPSQQKCTVSLRNC